MEECVDGCRVTDQVGVVDVPRDFAFGQIICALVARENGVRGANERFKLPICGIVHEKGQGLVPAHLK